ncbi:MAG: redox-sensitive transcriptional activator SoxR [Burkholderiales bacterium]|jgi:MerR family redox-sensitive transcriptional activator SoxR|nr:redox-sensitive transcriptional activator SoxR [Burkholderiales bacterium]
MVEVQVNLKSSPTSAKTTAAAPLTIGQLAERAGVATSALRFYEAEGLLAGTRSSGGHRQYPRHALRRVAFIRAAQAVGLTLPQIKAALATLPDGRTPTKADWTRLSASWAPLLDERIAALQKLRSKLTGCIGCGCLSLKACGLYNPQDKVADEGAGARLLNIETTT